mgnify:CR=1 FL=1
MTYITRELERKFLKLNDFLRLSLLPVQDRLAKQQCWSTWQRVTEPTSQWTMQWQGSLPILTLCCYSRPINRRSSLLRCRKRRNCSSKSKLFAMRAMKKFLFGLQDHNSTIWWKKCRKPLPEELAFWSYTAYPQEKKQGLYSIRIWIFRLPRCRQGSRKFRRTM